MPACANSSTERWPRLLGSLVTSVAVHLAILSTTGLAAFGLSPHTEGHSPGHLTAILSSSASPSAPDQPRKIAESGQHPVDSSGPSIPDPSAAPPRQIDRQQEQDSKLPLATNPAQASGLLPGPWYYPARYLHRRPTPLKPIYPAYPPEEENTQGHVMLLLLINEQGTVDSYQLMESQPAGRFDNAVIEAFTHETYAPGLITNYPVKSQLLVEVRFEPGSLPMTNILPGLAPLVNGQPRPIPSARGS